MHINMNVVIMDAKSIKCIGSLCPFVIASLISAQQKSSHHPPSLSLPSCAHSLTHIHSHTHTLAHLPLADCSKRSASAGQVVSFFGFIYPHPSTHTQTHTNNLLHKKKDSRPHVIIQRTPCQWVNPLPSIPLPLQFAINSEQRFK